MLEASGIKIPSCIDASDVLHAWSVRGPESVSPTAAAHGIFDSSSETDEQIDNDSGDGLESQSCPFPEASSSPRVQSEVSLDRTYDRDMAEYDTLPISKEEVLKCMGDRSGAIEDCKLVSMPQERFLPFTKKDLVHRGLYRPWFFPRFAKQGCWVSLTKTDALNDIRAITGSSRERNKQIAAKEREERERQREEDRLNRTMRKASAKRDEVAGDESSSSDEDPDVWVGCDSCSKWRRLPRGVEIDIDANFICTMLPRGSCSTPEEQWDHQADESTSSDACESSKFSRGSGKRKGGRSPVSGREKKAKRAAEDDESHDDLCREMSAMATLFQNTGAPSTMSRLSAVMQVLALTGKPLHYDLLTRQALALGLIKFTGSQGTAGESMKAFLNKTIRENKTAAIVNLGKGVYGLKEWITNGELSLPSSPVSGNSSPIKASKAK